MILINLLPQEMRLKESKYIRIPYIKIAIGIFLLVFVLTIYNLIVYVRIRGEYGTLQKQWNRLAEKSAQANALENELGSSITTEVDFYDSLVDPTLSTARILNIISDLIPKSVWLTELNFSRKKKDLDLTLVGMSNSLGETSKLVDIQNFINSLKAEMEKFISPPMQTNQAVKGNLKASVTTSSTKSENMDVTQFNASLKSESVEKK